jgi:hypothetical protein
MEQVKSQGATQDYKESDGASEAAEKAKARRQTEEHPLRHSRIAATSASA